MLSELENLGYISPGLSFPPECVNQSFWWTVKSLKTDKLAKGMVLETSLSDDKIWRTVQMEEDSDQYRRTEVKQMK